MTEPAHIRNFVSSAPVTIAPEETLDHATALMAKAAVRHLPVVKDGRLVGILSQRDIALTESIGRRGKSHTVEEAMAENPFTCGPEAHIHAVATELAEHKYGAAVVVDRDHPTRVVGVFTTVDALRALASFTRHQD